MFFIYCKREEIKSLPRQYGGGGPCEAWWKGRSQSSSFLF
ncbi:hypothetical protein HMPREF9163_01229 [Selenomonas sp. oral taxon 138 str. F0429]|nr:hypothetical protein HMPREF9163_01229 [Selenomonas sp. oral taxon 138 str. F0429]